MNHWEAGPLARSELSKLILGLVYGLNGQSDGLWRRCLCLDLRLVFYRGAVQSNIDQFGLEVRDCDLVGRLLLMDGVARWRRCGNITNIGVAPQESF